MQKLRGARLVLYAKRKRCYANLEAPLIRRGLLLPCGQPCLRRRDIRDLRDITDIGDRRDAADTGVVVLDEIRMGKLWVDKGFERVQRV